ncbi:MAG: DUF2325 domain-containing protein [Candidatus Schekmanbacteria bacterium]|nr:DUF2325 domain-containing protein [Candidatus Schekmanbacteria bacterium]
MAKKSSGTKAGKRRKAGAPAAALSPVVFSGIDPFWLEHPLLFFGLLVGLPGKLLTELGQHFGYPSPPRPQALWLSFLRGRLAERYEFMMSVIQRFWENLWRVHGEGKPAPDSQALRLEYYRLLRGVYDDGQPISVPLSLIGRIYTNGRVGRRRVLMSLESDTAKLLARDYPDLVHAASSLLGPPGEKIDVHGIAGQVESLTEEVGELTAKLRRAERRNEELEERLREVDGKLEAAQLDRRMAVAVAQATEMARGQESITALRLELRAMERTLIKAASEHEAVVETLESRLKQLQTERDELESAVLDEPEAGDEEPPQEGPPGFAGMRILVVGGRDMSAQREYVGAGGGLLLQEAVDPRAAIAHFPVSLVVFATSYLTHSTYATVKDACRRSQIPCRHWTGTSLESFRRALAGFGSR